MILFFISIFPFLMFLTNDQVDYNLVSKCGKSERLAYKIMIIFDEQLCRSKFENKQILTIEKSMK